MKRAQRGKVRTRLAGDGEHAGEHGGCGLDAASDGFGVRQGALPGERAAVRGLARPWAPLLGKLAGGSAVVTSLSGQWYGGLCRQNSSPSRRSR
jgi:hypothetical protein